MCRSANGDAALDFLWGSSDFVFAGALRQNDGLHVAGGAAFNFVVKKNPDYLATPYPNRSLCSTRPEHGFGRSVVGTLSSRHAGSAFCAQPTGAGACCQPRGLVLLRQTFLAFQPDVHLPPMERSCARPAFLSLVVGDRRVMCGGLLRAAFLWPKR